MKHPRLINYSLMLALVAALNGAGCSANQADNIKVGAGNDSLISLIADVHLLEARLLQLRARDDNSDSMAARMYDSLFAQYHTSNRAYQEQLTLLSEQPDEYLAVFDSVAARLERMKQANLE